MSSAGTEDGGAIEKFPIYTILPFEKAQRMMKDCDFDLEYFAKNYVSIPNGKSITII